MVVAKIHSDDEFGKQNMMTMNFTKKKHGGDIFGKKNIVMMNLQKKTW